MGFKEEVLRRSPILEVAQELIPGLRKVGRTWVGSTRGEKTPALTVYPHTESWYHYADGVGGDVIDLVSYVRLGPGFRARDAEQFVESLRWLAERAGVDWSSEWRGREPTLRDRVLGLTAQCYHARLMEMPTVIQGPALRGIDLEVLREFRVGVAAGDVLEKYLHGHGISREEAVEAGVLREDGREVFAGRVVFPTFSRGRVVYLTGRLLGEGRGPKYLHMRGAKPVYNDAALNGKGELVLVEGITDCLVLHGWGIPAIALQGTTLPEGLLATVRRHDPVYICLDGDAAGREAGLRLGERVGPLARVVRLPDGQDVRDVAVGGWTARRFREVLDAADTVLGWKLKEAANAVGSERDRRVEEVLRLMVSLPPVPLVRYEEEARSLLGLSSGALGKLLRAARRAHKASDEGRGTRREPVVVEGTYRVLSPALDYVGDVGVVAVPLLVRDGDGKVTRQPYLITSEREQIPLPEDGFVTIGGQPMVVPTEPVMLGSSSRWEYRSLEAFLRGARPNPVETYRAVERLFDRYVEFGEAHTTDVLALWTVGTYLYPLFETYPYIGLWGPPGSGKTKTMDVAQHLAFNMRCTADITPAGVYRLMDATRGALGIDEAERLGRRGDPWAEELRQVLNAGYKRGAVATRAEKGPNERFEVREFAVYGPKMLANIRGLEEVLRDRCIVIPMLRAKTEKGNLLVREGDEDWAGVRGDLYGVALTFFREVRRIYEEDAGIRVLNNRHGERWLPLLALAKFFEEEGVAGLVEAIRKYAVANARQGERSGLSEWDQALLLALRSLVKGEVGHVGTGDIVGAMRKYLPEEEGDGVTARHVGHGMQRLGLAERRRQARGYVYRVRRVDIEDRMERYEVEPPEEEEVR